MRENGTDNHISANWVYTTIGWNFMINSRFAQETSAAPSSLRADSSVTADRRYYVLRGRLWRLSKPFLDEKTHGRLVKELMAAKRTVREPLRAREDW
jgi:hypothetical protein